MIINTLHVCTRVDSTNIILKRKMLSCYSHLLTVVTSFELAP